MHSDPIGYFITCTCYGTWLPGDDRGWIRWHAGYQLPRPLLRDWCRDRMLEDPVIFTDREREVVEQTVRDHCEERGWELHEVNCRTTHVHIVVTAPGVDGETVRDQLKAWCTRKLKESQRANADGSTTKSRWWARGGSVRAIFDDESLAAAIEYAREGQERGGSRAGK